MNERSLKNTILAMHDAMKNGDLSAANDAYKAFQYADFERCLQNFSDRDVREWIDRGMDVNAFEDKGGLSPLMVALHEFNLKDVRHYLSLGAVVDYQDHSGSTALLYALKGHGSAPIYVAGTGDDLTSKEMRDQRLIDMISEVLKYQPDLSIKDNSGNTFMDYFSPTTLLGDDLKNKIQVLLDAYLEDQTLSQTIKADVNGGQGLEF